MAKRRFHRTRHHVAAGFRGGKGTAVSALVGAVTAFAVGKLAENVEFVRTNWYAPPAVLIGVGHFLKRKHLNVGTSVIAAGGAVGYYSYALTHQAQGAEGADAMPVDPGEAGEAFQGNAGAFDEYARLGASGVSSLEPADERIVEAYGLQG